MSHAKLRRREAMEGEICSHGWARMKRGLFGTGFSPGKSLRLVGSSSESYWPFGKWLGTSFRKTVPEVNIATLL